MRVDNKNNVGFTHKIILDVGASNPKGSLKVKIQKDNGEDIYERTGMYLNSTSEGFESSEDFIKKIEEVVKTFHSIAREIIAEDKTASRGEKELTGVGIFVPGTTIGDKIAFMPNLKDKAGNSLKDIDFSTYEKELKTQSTKQSGLEVNKSKFDLVVTKDLGGAGLALAKTLAQRNELKEGDYAIAIMTGGGYGDVELKVKNGIVNIETNECSSNLAYDKVNKKMEKLGRLGVTVKSHIGRFMEKLGMGEYSKPVVKAGDARIVTNNTMNVPTYETGILNELNLEKRFSVLSFENGENVLGLSTKSPIFMKKMQAARIDAVNDYAETIAQFGVNKINENLNKIYLVGPFAQGINRHVAENSKDYGAKDLADLIEKKIDNLIEEIDLPTTKALKELYNFKVICDPKIDFKNNTSAGDVLLNKELKFTPNRGGWLNIPLDALNPPT